MGSTYYDGSYAHISVEFEGYSAAELISKINRISEQHEITPEDIEVDKTIEADYGDDYAKIYLRYRRPMTDSEKADWMKQLADEKKRHEDYEKAQLKELKKKYGG